MVTCFGKSCSWVVCRGVLRQPRQRLAGPVRGASRRRPPHPTADPEMAQRWGDGGRRMVGNEDRECARFGDFTASREPRSQRKSREITQEVCPQSGQGVLRRKSKSLKVSWPMARRSSSKAQNGISTTKIMSPTSNWPSRPPPPISGTLSARVLP